MVQQGYLGSEPFAIEQAAHFKPVVLMLADAGYAGYGNIVTTSTKLVTEKPDVVQRFIDASIEGWYSYLYGDPAPANRLIKQDNPEMPDALLAYGHDVMKTRDIVDSGDALKLGIGAMTDARWAEFYRSMADVGVYPKGLDVTRRTRCGLSTSVSGWTFSCHWVMLTTRIGRPALWRGGGIA